MIVTIHCERHTRYIASCRCCRYINATFSAGSCSKMEWHVYAHEDGSGDWVVQAINFSGDGEMHTTIFSDSDAKARAEEYYQWKTAAVQEPKP